MSFLRELRYFALHLYHILGCWSYKLFTLFAHRFLYRFCSPATKAYLDHEYKIILRDWDSLTLLTLLTRLWEPFLLLRHPDGPFHLFAPSGRTLINISRSRAERTDTPSAAFLRIVHIVHQLITFPHLKSLLSIEIRDFWYRGITGASKPEHSIFGGKWYIRDLPDPREKLGPDPLLCAIAASTAEQMVEAYNWRIGLGIRRDLTLLRARKPYWDKNLVPCMMESVPEWCKHVGPAPVPTVVDRKGGKDLARSMLESEAIDVSPSFKKRNLIVSSQFLYFA